MIYVMSDLHGSYQAFLEAIKTIQLSDQDTLYLLGDLVDRGNDSCQLLLECMNYPNIIPILGNHDYMAYRILSKLTKEITLENVENYLKEDDLIDYMNWIMDGGYTTIQEYQKLSLEQKEMILDYLSDFSFYEEVTINHIHYTLVHAGLEPYDPNKQLEDYQLHELIFTSPSTHYQNGIYIVGHKVVDHIQKDDHIIYIDCGYIYGNQLGILCLDNMKEYYIQKTLD